MSEIEPGDETAGVRENWRHQTLRKVGTEWAADVGRMIAGVLHCGFSLGSALGIVQEMESLGDRYVVIGDGHFSLPQAESDTPMKYEVSPTGEKFELYICLYPTGSVSVGVFFARDR